MTDPFDALREPVVPVDPDPEFAATLRARLERALALPRGVTPVTVTETARTPEPADGPAATPEPVRLGSAIPYLAVPVGDGRRALDWYVEVLGAGLVGEPILMPDGKLGHAELALGGGVLYLAEEFPDIGHVAPGAAGTPVGLWLAVPDAADTARRAVDGGATLKGPISDRYGHRSAEIIDPFGHRWMLQTPLAALPATERDGDIGYVWLTVPDPDRAAAFYAAVLGWEYAPGHAPGGRDVEGRSTKVGIGSGAPGFHVSYAVQDVPAAVQRVRAAGGTGDAEDRSYGTAADCVDDQGVSFSLHEAGIGTRPPANGAGPGDLSYLTLEVVDTTRARAFYGAVLGWTFEPGGMPDGYAPRGVVPMTGLHGGNPVHTAVPMWKVADVAAAVGRVRAAGGSATDPEQQSYGATSECTDDQGIRFYLGDS